MGKDGEPLLGNGRPQPSDRPPDAERARNQSRTDAPPRPTGHVPRAPRYAYRNWRREPTYRVGLRARTRRQSRPMVDGPQDPRTGHRPAESPERARENRKADAEDGTRGGRLCTTF